MARSTEQVLNDHLRAISTGDFPALMADYADDAVLMTMDGANVGKEAIGAYFINGLSASAQFQDHVNAGTDGRRRRADVLDRRLRRRDRPPRRRHLRHPR